MATIKGITSAQAVVLEQTRVARYLALAETIGGFTVPDGTPGGSDRTFEGFEFPGVIESPSVLFFRTRHTGRPTFSIDLNTDDVTVYTFTDADPPERSWHQIIPATMPGGAPFLMAQNNQIIFGVTGDGSVTFGDVVFLYTSNETTVKIPIVISAKQ
jgi:hypothetical protein